MANKGMVICSRAKECVIGMTRQSLIYCRHTHPHKSDMACKKITMCGRVYKEVKCIPVKTKSAHGKEGR